MICSHLPQQVLNIIAAHIAQYDNGMLAGIGLEQLAEVGTAGAEDDLVGGKGAFIAGERHIDEVLLIA